jgi:hypothetical protein
MQSFCDVFQNDIRAHISNVEEGKTEQEKEGRTEQDTGDWTFI